MRPLRQCLLDTYPVRLQVISRLWEIALSASRQRDVALELADAMEAPEAVARVWESLPDDQRRALHALLVAEGYVPRRVFTRRWGEIRPMGPGRMERMRPWEDPISPAEGLWYRGLIFRAFEQGSDGAYEAVFVPPELQARLPAPDTSPPTIALEPVPSPALVRASGDKLLDDACTLLAYLQNERPRLRADGSWPQRHESRLLRRLHDANRERLGLLRHLAHRIGWVRESESRRRRLDPDALTSWLKSGSYEQRGAMTTAWRDDPAWNDLFHVPSLRPEDTGAWRNDPRLARKAVLRHLKACAPSTWYALDDFIAAIKRIDPDFQRPDGDYDIWYIRDATTGGYLSGFESWDAVEGALIRHLITGPIAWLGLVDRGAAAADEESIAFRLTTDGTAFLGLAEPPPPPDPASLDLRPGFILIVPSARRYERFQLARVADWARTGDPFVYWLTPRSLERGKGQGISVTRVLEFLREVTEAPVPRHVEAALTRWDARGTEARLGQAMLLQLSDEDLMSQVTSSPHLQRFIQERVGPTAAVVRERDWPRLVAALGEMGLLPEVHTSTTADVTTGSRRVS